MMKEDDSTIIRNKKDRTLTIDSISAHDYDEICLINPTLFTADRQKNTNEIKKKRKNSHQVSIPSQTSSGETFSSQKMSFADKKGLLASS